MIDLDYNSSNTDVGWVIWEGGDVTIGDFFYMQSGGISHEDYCVLFLF